MVVVFRPYESRWKRAWRVLKAKPQYWLKHHPEQFIGYLVVIPGCTIMLSYMFYTKGPINDYTYMAWREAPYYRDHYEVRRPDDPIVKNWRVPEDYPAPFLTNRLGEKPSKTWKFYAWD